MDPTNPQDTPPKDPAPESTPPAGAGAEQVAERYAGKSDVELIAMHREAQQKITELSQQNSTFRGFFTEVQPWINVDPQSGKLDLNKKTVLPYIQSEGWLPPTATPVQNENGTPPEGATREAFQDKFDADPKETISSLVEEQVRLAREDIEKNKVEPLQRAFKQTQERQWIEKLEGEVPEFASRDVKRELGTFINDNNLPEPTSFEALRKAYTFMLADKGQLVNKAEAEAREGQLRKTLSAVGPEFAQQPQKSPDDDLFDNGTTAGPDAGVMETLMQ